jgi:hypothetical protein
LLIPALAHWPTQLSAEAVIGGFLFSVAAGVFLAFIRRARPRGSTLSKRYVMNEQGRLAQLESLSLQTIAALVLLASAKRLA